MKEAATCPAAGCTRRIDGSHPLCSKCWYSLTGSMRTQLGAVLRERRSPVAVKNAWADIFATLERRDPRRGPRCFIAYDGQPLPMPRLHRDGCGHTVAPENLERLASGKEVPCASCGATFIPTKEVPA